MWHVFPKPPGGVLKVIVIANCNFTFSNEAITKYFFHFKVQKLKFWMASSQFLLRQVCCPKGSHWQLGLIYEYGSASPAGSAILKGSRTEENAEGIWALPVWWGGLNPCPDGLGNFFCSTLLYPVSLLIGGWDWVQGGNPLYAAVKCLSDRRGQIWRIFLIFFCKKHMSHPFRWWNFFGGSKIFFTPSNGPFLGGTDTFQELRGPSQNWGAGLWDDPRRFALECFSNVILRDMLAVQYKDK